MPEWLDKTTIELGIAILSGLLLPAAVFWGQKYFASRSAMNHVSSALNAYIADHKKAHLESEEEHRRNEGRIDQLESQFTRIDERLKYMPSRADLDGLSRSIGDLTSLVRKVEAEVKGVTGSVNTLQTTVNMLVKNELSGKS